MRSLENNDGFVVKKASEYAGHAAECRALAHRAQNDEHRLQLVTMAETWDRLATERAELIARHPELEKKT